MKDLYKGYQKRTVQEIKKIWDEGSITFDTNFLLNIYRYSENTRKELLRLVDKLSHKIFLTHQAGLEFHRNRFEVISEQEKVYKEFYESLNKIEEELRSKSRHPFIEIKLQQKLQDVFKEVKEEISNNEKYYENLITYDDIYTEINRLFHGKVEKPFSKEELKIIFDEGEKRYKLKLPPGYEDEKEKENNRQFGDLILWKQIIKKTKENKKSILLITDERKKDWWWKLKNGKTIGPRQELVEEIFNEAGVDFHLYSTEKFLEYGLSYLKEKSNPKAIEEIKERKDELNRASTSELKPKISLLESLREKYGDQYFIEEMHEKNDELINQLQNELLVLKYLYKEESKNINLNKNSLEKLNNITTKTRETERNIELLKSLLSNK